MLVSLNVDYEVILAPLASCMQVVAHKQTYPGTRIKLFDLYHLFWRRRLIIHSATEWKQVTTEVRAMPKKMRRITISKIVGKIAQSATALQSFGPPWMGQT